MIGKYSTAALLVCALASPALGAEKTVSASAPEAMDAVMEAAGYKSELHTDSVGDPLITAELGGWTTNIYFYGCDASKHNKCDSVQFVTGFDREEPWTAAEAMKITEDYRFAAVHLDDEGDPFISWDLVTGDGIPATVFLVGLRKFEQALHNAADKIFADSGTEKAE